jgi:hypothetical protein
VESVFARGFMAIILTIAVPDYRVLRWRRDDFFVFKREESDSSYFQVGADEDCAGA